MRDPNQDLLFIFPFQEVLDACQDRKPIPLDHTLRQVCATANQAKRIGEDFRNELRNMQSMLKQSRALLQGESE